MKFEKRKDCYFDTETRLEWSLENYDPMPWQSAIEFCKALGNGWRLPTIQELLTLVDYTKFAPATELPHMVSASYWSSTTHADFADSAWGVYFHDGYNYWRNKSSNYYVRAVRGELKYKV